MIERDWHSFLDELLELPALHAVQQRIRQEEADMPKMLHSALMPLAYTRPSQLAFGAQDTASERYGVVSHSLRHVRLYLRFVQTNRLSEDELHVLTSYMCCTIEENTQPRADDKLTEAWQEFFKELRQLGHAQAVLKINELNPYFVMGQSHLVVNTIKEIRTCGSLPRMVAIVDKALAAGS